MPDWDIEPRDISNPDKTPVFEVVYKPRIGRWYTKGQAARMAAEANGFPQDITEIGLRMEIVSITSRRDKKKKKPLN